METYEQKYKVALSWMRKVYATMTEADKEVAEHYFPELKESEDEMIRKKLLLTLSNFGAGNEFWKHSLQISKDKVIAWLEKQLDGIQWTGDNLKDVIEFTGYSPKFGEWFKTWEEYETYVHTHNNIFKIFNEDGSHYEVPVGAWIVKTPDGYNVASKATYIQKPANKVEPKFKAGDWIISDKAHEDYHICKIIEVSNDNYKIESIYGYSGYNECKVFDCIYKLWTIEDAKPGDVLAAENGWTCIFKSLDGNLFSSYCFMDKSLWFCKLGSNAHLLDERFNGKLFPATKEQRSLLFSKIHEAGYEWDADKLELKNIEQKPVFNNDKIDIEIWAKNEQRILKINGRVIRGQWYDDATLIYKNFVLPAEIGVTLQKPAEWSEEDEEMLTAFLHKVEICDLLTNRESVWGIKRLKSLKPQPHWKPSEEQMYALKIAIEVGTANESWAIGKLKSLYDELSKLF